MVHTFLVIAVKAFFSFLKPLVALTQKTFVKVSSLSSAQLPLSVRDRLASFPVCVITVVSEHVLKV